MGVIKSYTDLEQSKKLSKILPLESADMWWSRCTITDFGDGILKVSYAVEPCNISQFKNTREDVPCWSVAALLDIMPLEVSFAKQTDGENIYYYTASDDARYCDVHTQRHLNIVDACVEMILILKERNLI